MKALVLAAGLGTRLRPLTLVCAKPALPVLGIPGLWFGAWHLKRELAPEAFAINLSHLPQTVRQAASDAELRSFTGIDFDFSDESSGILGSSGALWKLASWIGNETLAVCNGDALSFPSWKRMADFHRKSGALITLHVRSHSNSVEGYTDIKVDASGRITAFDAKATSGLMFSGSYLFEPELLARLPAGVSELRPTLLEPLIREKKLAAFREDLDWFDIGTSATYAQAHFELLARLPQARALIECKMQERFPGTWTPRAWGTQGAALKLTGPVALTGELADWTRASKEFGPRFIGIAPPPAGLAIPVSNAIVVSNQITRL